MVRIHRRTRSRIGAIAFLAVLALVSGCGRKSWPPTPENRDAPAQINPTTYTAAKPPAPAAGAETVREGASSLDLLLGRVPDMIQYKQEQGQWVLTLPTKDRVAWASGGSGPARLVFMLDAEPLIKAGLKPDLLKAWQFRLPDLALDGALAIPTLTKTHDFGAAAALSGSDTAGAAFGRLLSSRAEAVGYNADLAHFILNLGGERLEWSRDINLSDEDINLVLLADPLLQAGVNIGKLDKNIWFYQPANQYRPDALLIKIIKL